MPSSRDIIPTSQKIVLTKGYSHQLFSSVEKLMPTNREFLTFSQKFIPTSIINRHER